MSKNAHARRREDRERERESGRDFYKGEKAINFSFYAFLCFLVSVSHTGITSIKIIRIL